MNGAMNSVKGSEFRRRDLQQYGNASNLHINEKIKDIIKKGGHVYHLSFGQSPFPVPAKLEQALQKHAHRHEYANMAGITELREAICTFHRNFPVGIPDSYLTPDNVVVSDGSKMIIYLLMVVTETVVVLVAPAWTTYPSQVKLAGKKSITVQTTYDDGWKLTPNALREAIASQAEVNENMLVIFTNPGNPDGKMYTEDELKDLAEVFREYNMVVVSDEIYAYLSYADDYTSLSKFYPEGTIITSGLSKWASAGGWRLGYAVFPPELSCIKNTVVSAASHTFSCAAVPQQCAAAEFMSQPEECRQFMKHSSRILYAVSQMCIRKLTEVGLKVRPSKAGYYIYPDFSNLRENLAKKSIHTGQEMCDAIFEDTKVSLLPGAIIHLEPSNALTTRLCYVNFDGKLALEESINIGLDKTLSGDFVATYCKDTVAAIEVLADWCTQVKNL